MKSGAFADAVVVVTGASSGLGREIAVGAAASGARVVIVNYANNTEDAEATAELVECVGAEAVLARGNVGVDDNCRSVIAAAAPFGRVDVLFNNAGISRPPTYGDLDALGADDFLDIYRVNVVGPYQMVRAARRLLEASPTAAVVNTSSLAGVTGEGSSIAYSVAKGALNTMTRSLAIALAPKIRVNAICPGFIDTPWFDKFSPAGGSDGLREQMRNATPLKVVSTPEDVAETALFLGSNAARHVTGEILIVDGGLHLRGA